MPMPKVSGIVNMNSRFCRNGLVGRIEEAFKDINGSLYKTHDSTSLNEAIDKLSKDQPDLGFIAAGDGGLVLTLTEYFKCYGDQKPVKLWYLPTGTHDKEARDLGIFSQLAFTGRRNQQRERFLSEVTHDLQHKKRLKMKKKNILKITTKDEKGNNEIIYAFDFGAGVPVEAVMKYYGLTCDKITSDAFQNSRMNYDPFGMATTFLKGIADTLSSAQPYKRVSAKIKIESARTSGWLKRDEVHTSEDYLGIFISAGETVLPFMKPFYLAHNQNGGAHFLASTMSDLSVIKYLPRFTFGYSLKDDEQTIEREITSVKIEFARPEIIQFAGEFRKAVYAKVEVLQDMVEFIVPNLRGRIDYLENIAHPILGKVAKRTLMPAYEAMFNVTNGLL